MKPTFAKHVVRSLLREIGVESQTAFPDVNNNKKFAAEYLAYNVLRKFEPDEGTYDPVPAQRASLRKWADSEWTCRVVNHHGRYFSPIYPEDVSLFSTLKQRTRFHINRILSGSYVDFEDLSFSAGATSSARRTMSSPEMKWSGMPDHRSSLLHNLACNANCVQLVTDFLNDNETLYHLLCRRRDNIIDHSITPGYTVDDIANWLVDNYAPSVMSSVAKDDTSVRLIGLSGSLLVAFQRCVGISISECLLNVGVDLKDQTVNQQWALIGSLTSLTATVDLSSASDNVSIRSLEYFPKYYQEIIMGVRDVCVTSKTGGRAHRLEKLSGMGSGFIFEYETVLFYAMCLAVCESTSSNTEFVTVYGDDIIIPSKAADMLRWFFLYNGFSFNATKSFSCKSGFRESCGKHYYNGVDVSPFYVRGEIHGLGDKYHLLNQLIEWSNRTGISISKTIDLVVDSIPLKHRKLVPLTWGTRTGLHYEVAGVAYPREKWNKHLQRHTITYQALRPELIDESDRMPEIVHYRGSLLSLQRPEFVTWEHFSDIPISVNVLFLLRGYAPLKEYIRPKFGSEYKERLKLVVE